MISYLNEGENYLRIAESYYEFGASLEEIKALRTAAFYAALMNALNRVTGDTAYVKKRYDVSERVYQTRFKDIDDNDIKFMFLQYLCFNRL